MKDNEINIIYKAVDQMTSVQTKIMAQQEKMLKLFASSGKTAETAGTQTQNGMTKAGKSISSVDGQIAKLNKSFSALGVQLDTIDIYMISAFKVTALWGLVDLVAKSTLGFAKLENSIRGVAAISEYMGINVKDALDSINQVSQQHSISVDKLASSYRNLVQHGMSLDQVKTSIDALLLSGAVLGTQGGIPLEQAVERVTEGFLNQRSAITDNTHLTKNLDMMWRDYAITVGIVGRELTAQEKVMAEVAYLIELKSALLPGYTESMKGLEGQIRKTSTEWQNFKDILGKQTQEPAAVGMYLLQEVLAGLKSKLQTLQQVGMTVASMGSYVADSFNTMGSAVKQFFTQLTVNNPVGAFENIGVAYTIFVNKLYATPDLSYRWRQWVRDMQGIAKEFPVRGPVPFDAPLPTGVVKSPATLPPIKESEIVQYWDNFRHLSSSNADRALIAISNSVRRGVEDLEKAYGSRASLDKLQEFENLKGNIIKAGQAKIVEYIKESAQQRTEVEKRHQLSVLEMQRTTLDVSKQDYYEKKVALTEQLIKAEKEYLKTLSKLEDTTAWRAQVAEVDRLDESLAQLNMEALKISGTFAEGMSYGLKKFVYDSQSMFEAGAEMTTATLGATESTLNNLFTDFRNHDLKSWQTYLTSFSSMVAQALQEVIIKMLVVKALSTALSGFSGGLGGGGTEMSAGAGAGAGLMPHGGMDSIERFHAGTGLGSSIKTDEVLAILQTKERVMSRSQSARFEQLGKAARDGKNIDVEQLSRRDKPETRDITDVPVINNFTFPSIDASSTASFIYNNKDAIASAVSAAMSRNHPSRR